MGAKAALGVAKAGYHCVKICLDGCGVVWLIGCLDLDVAEVRARRGLLVFIDHGWGNDEVSLLRSMSGRVCWSGLCGTVLEDS